jgi:hypothetical protein
MNITIERLEQIEFERTETTQSINYQNWFKELNVSRLYTNPESRLNAKDIMDQYDYNNYKFNIKL